MEVKIAIVEANCEVMPKDWIVQTKSGKLVLPSAGGEYRRLLKNGAKAVHLYVVTGNTIKGRMEEPFFNKRLNVIGKYFDTHEPYLLAGELTEVLASTNSNYYDNLPNLSRWYKNQFIELYNKGEIKQIYCMGRSSKSDDFKLKFIDRETETQRIDIQGFEVVGNSDSIEGRGQAVTIAYATNQITAQEIARGKGVMGQDARVTAFNKTFILHGSIEEYNLEQEKSLKARALNKLTAEEKTALGL